MPCRSDYMEPTYDETRESLALRKKFEDLGDRATHGADVLREYLLNGGEEPYKYVSLHLGVELTKLKAQNSKLYVQVPQSLVDQISELVDMYEEVNTLLVTRGQSGHTKKQLKHLGSAQEEHREQDLRRLMKTFGEAGDRVRLAKVLAADNTKPLAPHLGFDPDEF